MASGKAAASGATVPFLPTSSAAENTNDTNDQEPTTSATDDESDSDEDLDPQSPTISGYKYGDHKFHSRFKFLNDQVEKTFASAAPTFLNREEHNAYYRATWAQLRDSVAADNTIPDSIFDPPRTFVQVRMSQWPVFENEGHYCCPCDLPDDDLPSIDISEVVPTSSAGVGSSTIGLGLGEKRAVLTKDLFLKVVGDAFYGEKYTVGAEEDRPVIDHFDYMISNEDSLMGHVFAMVRGFKKPIWKI